MPELEQKQFQRQVAFKTLISSVLNSKLVKEGISTYAKINGLNVSRVNVIANLVFKSEEKGYSSGIIDDSTGKISLRSFESAPFFSNIEIGSTILVIGKIREYGNEKYIVPEIVKKIGIEWMSLRKIELKDQGISKIESSNPISNVDGYKDVYNLIKKLDSDEGVSIDDLIVKMPDAEKIINKMLENGDVFEIKPGRLRVLE